MKILVIFGAGTLGKYVIEEAMAYTLEEYENVYFFDNNKSLWGTMISGIEVISEEKVIGLSKIGTLDVVIATDYWREILNQCNSLGLNQNIIEIVTRKTAENYRYWNKSFSQDGEDLFLKTYFMRVGKKDNGFYVDIGAHHPLRFSNTAWAYKMGWHGINIEPNIDAISLFNEYRKRDINLQIGCGRDNCVMEYYRYEEAALNSFDQNVYPDLVPISTEQIEVKPLSTIFEENNVGKIDLLTIDVEGLEYVILKTNDWTRWKPEVVIVEQFAGSVEEVISSDIYTYMKEIGYYFGARTRLNSIYIKK